MPLLSSWWSCCVDSDMSSLPQNRAEPHPHRYHHHQQQHQNPRCERSCSESQQLFSLLLQPGLFLDTSVGSKAGVPLQLCRSLSKAPAELEKSGQLLFWVVCSFSSFFLHPCTVRAAAQFALNVQSFSEEHTSRATV